MRNRINIIEERRAKVEKNVEFKDIEAETEAEKLIRIYQIKLKQPKENCGPQMVDLCTLESAFGQYMKRPNINKILKGLGNEEQKKKDFKEFNKVLKESKNILITE